MDRCSFLETVGETPELKILDLLIEGEDFDYSLTDISNESGVSWVTVNKTAEKLEKENLIIHTRRIGSAKLFRINKNNLRIKTMTSIHNKICSARIDELLSEKDAEI